MFEELSLESVVLALYREGDYTVRLFCRNMASPKRYLFAVLRFDGRRGVWTVSLMDQNLRTIWGTKKTRKTFEKAKQTLIDVIKDWQRFEPAYYKITKLDTGYYIPPWLRRKRPVPTQRHLRKVLENYELPY
jgi:hypothetical protein